MNYKKSLIALLAILNKSRLSLMPLIRTAD
jgi:hypothetical protein